MLGCGNSREAEKVAGWSRDLAVVLRAFAFRGADFWAIADRGFGDSLGPISVLSLWRQHAGIDPHTRAGKNRLIEWLYENQSSEGREGYGNRIFIVCNAHTTKEKYYLKTRFNVIEKKIKAYMSYIKNHPFNTVNLIKNDILYSNIKSDVIYISEDLLEDNK